MMTQLLIHNESHCFKHFADFIITRFGLHFDWTVQIIIIIFSLLCLPILNKMSSLNVTAFFIGTESKMKLWDVLATCLLLLSSVAARPLYQNTQPAKRTYFPSSYSDSASLSVEDEEPTFQSENHNLQEISMEDQCKAHGMFQQNLFVMCTHCDGLLNGE